MVPYNKSAETFALNILQNIDFKNSTHWKSRDTLVTMHIIPFLDKLPHTLTI